MKFSTELHPTTLQKQIRYSNRIMAIGSCFTENIGNKLGALKYNLDINPFGIQYNPASIAKGLDRIISGTAFKETELFEYQGLWQSFMHHSEFSATDPIQVIAYMNQRLQKAHSTIKQTDFLLLTLGTAKVYSDVQNGEIVNNCHKLPAQYFHSFRLDVKEAASLLISPLQNLRELNPNINVLITISPIRHLKDGFHENQLSKSTLLLAAEKIIQELDFVSYFPAYELMMDDLRDYRFYASDMTHPSELAIDYIWGKFETHCLLQEEADIRKEVLKIVQAAAHRLFNPELESSLIFAEKQLQKIMKLQKKHPFLIFEKEIQYFNSILDPEK